MKKTTTSSHLDCKVTDFFPKKPKAGPRPDQPVYDISSSSERQSVIFISSDDAHSASMSKLAPRSSSRIKVDILPSAHGRVRSTADVAPLPLPGATHATAEYVLSSSPGPSGDRTHSHSPEIQLIPRSSQENASAAQKNASAAHKNVSAGRKNAKKRKQPPISLITSEESDDPVLPSIRVNSRVTTGLTLASPLAPKQYTLSPSKRSPHKLDAPVKLSTQPSQSGSSAPKRARHEHGSASDNATTSAPDCDADDESENGGGDEALRRRSSWKEMPSRQQQTTGTAMDVDVPTSNDRKDAPRTWKTTPREDAEDVLPSSQDDEMVLRIIGGPMKVDAPAPSTHVSPPQPVTLSQAPVTPSKSRTNEIIARIKAKADADAAVLAQDERRQSLGRTSEESMSDLSSLPSLSSDDDDELEFELSMFKSTRVVTGSGLSEDDRSRTRSQTPGGGIRRSTRNANVPAPNYAKRLELFRENTPPPSGQTEQNSNDVKVKGKGKAKMVDACPLDTLLKDNEREDARRVKAERKRKAHVLGTRGSSPALASGSGSAIAPNRHSGLFETPQRPHRKMWRESPSSDVSSALDGDIHMLETLMGDAEREELLGKRGAEAVGKILEGDRKKGINVDKTEEEGVVFWDGSEGDNQDVVPALPLQEQSIPLLNSLYNLVLREDFTAASLLLESGAIAAIPLPAQPVGWLFSTAMSIAQPSLSKSAYRALLALHRGSLPNDPVTRVQVSSGTILPALIKFGVPSVITKVLGAGASAKTSVIGVSQEAKVEIVCRFVTMVSTLGRSHAIELEAMPSVILALLLLSIDVSAVPELQRDAVAAVENMLANPKITRVIELGVCKAILHATTSLPIAPNQQVQLFALLPGCGSSSGRVRRWTAWAMLGGDLESVQECEDVPPLEVLARLFTEDPVGNMKLEVNRDTDYDLLGSRVDVLSVAMTDVDTYVRSSRSATGSGDLESICKGLEWMNGKIVDTRAAHLDRTRTKDAINRLHKRLVYQRHAALEVLRGTAGKMDGFVTKIRPKSRPKPMEI